MTVLPFQTAKSLEKAQIFDCFDTAPPISADGIGVGITFDGVIPCPVWFPRAVLRKRIDNIIQFRFYDFAVHGIQGTLRGGNGPRRPWDIVSPFGWIALNRSVAYFQHPLGGLFWFWGNAKPDPVRKQQRISCNAIFPLWRFLHELRKAALGYFEGCLIKAVFRLT